MNEPSHYKTPETEEEIDAFVMKYRDAATNVLRCGTGQAGIVRYLEHVEGFSSEDSNRLSYPLFDKAKKKLRRTQWPKLIIAIFLLIIGIVGPVTLFSQNCNISRSFRGLVICI